jgi:uncharacterized membrane protein YozB (DUF420 family)
MFPQGFFGTRADLLFDLVITSLFLIVPLLVYSWRMAGKGQYQIHRNIQMALTLVLTAVLVVFEMNLRSKGGIFEMTQGSRFAGTSVLSLSIYGHMLLAFSTATIWLLLVATALRKFPASSKPGRFQNFHRFWGRFALITMIFTGISAVELYVVGFVL